MNKNLTKRIIQFLEVETNYALLLRGGYGVGKTHYLKNIFFQKARNTLVPNSSNGENYQPVLISLFGIRSVEEIQEQLFLELFPTLKNKGVKINPDNRIILKKIFYTLDIDQYIKTRCFRHYDVFNINKLIICFDDINRKSEGFKIHEFFGFINNILENSNIKVILIANEDELIRVEDT